MSFYHVYYLNLSFEFLPCLWFKLVIRVFTIRSWISPFLSSISPVNLILRLCQTYWKRDGLWSLIISCTLIYKGITREITENILTKTLERKNVKGKRKQWNLAYLMHHQVRYSYRRSLLIQVLLTAPRSRDVAVDCCLGPLGSSFFFLSNGRLYMDLPK